MDDESRVFVDMKTFLTVAVATSADNQTRNLFFIQRPFEDIYSEQLDIKTLTESNFIKEVSPYIDTKLAKLIKEDLLLGIKYPDSPETMDDFATLPRAESIPVIVDSKKDFSSIDWSQEQYKDLRKLINRFTIGNDHFPESVIREYFPDSSNVSYRLVPGKRFSLELGVGDVYEFPYTSSYARDIESLAYFYKNVSLDQYTGHLTVIKVNNKNGIKFGYDISDISHYQGEGEVIIPSGVRFKVSKINKNVKYKGIGKVTEYVVDLDESSVASYIKQFEPLPKAESAPLVQPFYSSLERLIEKQRPLDKRNGTQWRKYFITQGMSEAEMKHTGVWDELEKSGRKDIPKETLLATIDKNRVSLGSFNVAIPTGKVDVLEWDEPQINIEITDEKNWMYRAVHYDIEFSNNDDPRIYVNPK